MRTGTPAFGRNSNASPRNEPPVHDEASHIGLLLPTVLAPQLLPLYIYSTYLNLLRFSAKANC